MKEKIEQYLTLQSQLKSEMKEWVKNEDIPLDERWKLFIKSELGDIHDWYMEPPGIDWSQVTLHDDFYLEKNEECNVERFIERALDKEGKDGFEDCTKESLIRFFMVENFLKAFVNEW